VKQSNNGWVLYDDTNNPFIIKGVCYSPTPIGETVWVYNMFEDENRPWFTDGDYMEQMGVNTVRIYDTGNNVDKYQKFIRQMYKLYSIYTIFPLPLKMEGADFGSEEYKERVKKKILDVVEEYKDTPGIIFWLLGNEIDYFFYDNRAYWDTEEIRELNSPFRRAKARAEIVFRFANNITKEIKKIDDAHPVGISLGQTFFFNLIKENLPDIDFVGLNYYQGRNFSTVWSSAKKFNKPVLITEFGYDAFNTKTRKEDEKSQAKFIVSLWKDIYRHTWVQNDSAIALGGCIFEWTDEWWKYPYGGPDVHDKEGSWPNPAWLDFSPENPNNVQEEWFGIFKIVPSENEKIDKRIPRLVYYKLKEIWNPGY